MAEIVNWEEIQDTEFDNLLLGNGFSMNVSTSFRYESLLDLFDGRPVGRYKCTKDIFDKLETSNFETVLKAIYHALIVSIDNEDALNTLYSDVRSALISAVKSIHPQFENVQVKDIAKELCYYRNVYTTNYDLILYWVILNELSDKFIDFFWGCDMPFKESQTEVFSSKIPIYYLHGALHLKSNIYGQSYKSRITLNHPEDFFDDIGAREFPLFISEGHSDLKRQKIDENNYLRFCFNSLEQSTGSMLVFGHDLHEDFDRHIIEAIKNSQVDFVAVSVFSRLPTLRKSTFVARVREALAPINVVFFESASHPFGDLRQ